VGRSFEELYKAEYGRVFRAAYFVLGDEHASRDATQEAFTRAFARWPRLRKESWAGGWVMTTALNLCKRHRTEPRPDPADSSFRAVQEPPNPNRVDVQQAMRRLPFRQLQAVILYYLGDLPIPAVASLMGISDGGVKAHLAQARRNLRPNLEVIDV
jgi:RNA polymerase sigma factor (sigma-70 family)